MLSLNGFHPSSLSPLWTSAGLYAASQVPPLHSYRNLMLRNMEDMRSSLEILRDLERYFFQDFEQIPSSGDIQSVPVLLEKKADRFALTVDAKDYAPEELFVKQVGNKLQVCGKSEKKHEDGKGSYSYRVQAFKRQLYLPEGTDPETVTCKLADGKLYIEAPTKHLSAIAERKVPITCSPADSTERQETGQEQGQTTGEETKQQ